MHLSVGIMMGDHLRKRDGGITLGKDGHGACVGCAIGGAILAMGGRYSWEYKTLFPWLQMEFRENSDPMSIHEYWGAVSRRFFRVMDGEMTLEALVDWVRSVEPSCGECNEFACKCVQKMDETPTLHLQEVTQ